MVIVNIVIAIVFYFVLMWLSVNLLGLFVRGFFTNPDINKLKLEGHDFIKQEIEKSERADKWLNLIAFLCIVGYLYATFHFWNIGFMVVALVLMLARLPDLLWEIKTGEKITTSIVKSMPKNVLYYATTFLTFAALPALYYFLYHF